MRSIKCKCSICYYFGYHKTKTIKSEKKEAFSLFPAVHKPRKIIFRVMQNYQQTPNPVEKRTYKKMFHWKNLCSTLIFFFWQLRENNDSLRFSLKKIKRNTPSSVFFCPWLSNLSSV